MSKADLLRAQLQLHGGDLERTKALSDGVFAFALTLLVLELHVPALKPGAGDAELWKALLEQLPHLMSFLISFYVVAMYWRSHALFCRIIERADRRAIWRNIHFLLLIAFLPFPTALLGSYPGLRVAWTLYAGNLVCLGLVLRSFFTYVADQGLLKPDVSPQLVAFLRARSLVTPALFLASIPVAFASPVVAEYVPLLIPVASFVLERRAPVKIPAGKPARKRS